MAGDLQGGSGDLTVGDGVFQGAYSFESRFEEGQGTNPEELIASAHAACFSMALSGILAEHGHEPRRVDTITKVDLTTTGDVPGVEEAHFREHAEEAKAGYSVSKALAGVGEITLQARLA